MTTNDRNYYISSERISHEAIRTQAQRIVDADPTAFVVIHFHPYESDAGIPPCNEVCYRVERVIEDESS